LACFGLVARHGAAASVCFDLDGQEWLKTALTFSNPSIGNSTVLRFALLVFIFDIYFRNIWIH
jgi:hypothetical protein